MPKSPLRPHTGRGQVVATLVGTAVVVGLGVWALVVAVHPEVASVQTCGSRYVPGQGSRFSCGDSTGAEARLGALVGLSGGDVTIVSTPLLWLARVCLLGPVLAFVVSAFVQWAVRPNSARGQLRNARLRRTLRRLRS